MTTKLVQRLSPSLIIGLTVMWLALNQTVALPQVLLGATLALLLTWASAALRPLHAQLRRVDAALILIPLVLYEIVRSNIAVARIVLSPIHESRRRSDFLDIPLELRDPHGLAVLAMIITATPGTIWAGLSPDGVLTLHVLDLVDGEELARRIKRRFERPLRRIFE